MYVCICIRICMCVFVYVYVCVCVYICLIVLSFNKIKSYEKKFKKILQVNKKV